MDGQAMTSITGIGTSSTPTMYTGFAPETSDVDSAEAWSGDSVLIPQAPLPSRNQSAKKNKNKQSNKKLPSHKRKGTPLSKSEKARRYDNYVVNDKAPKNRDAQIGDFLDRMTFDSENLFPTNSARIAKFVPIGFKSATVRGTRFNEPPIPFKSPKVQAAVNASELFNKYKRDNPVGGPYTDKRLYNSPMHRAATRPAQKSYAQRLSEGWDNLTPDEQQVFKQAGGKWFTDNFLSTGTSTPESRENNIAEFVRILNERNRQPNLSDVSPLFGQEAGTAADGSMPLAEASDVPDDQWLANVTQWLQNQVSASGTDNSSTSAALTDQSGQQGQNMFGGIDMLG
jgi:hypothetical protein